LRKGLGRGKGSEKGGEEKDGITGPPTFSCLLPPVCAATPSHLWIQTMQVFIDQFPISRTTLKLTEHVVASRFSELLPPKTSCQFCSQFITLYTPLKRRYYQSITTSFGRSILAIYLCLLVLLDLSADFDTVVHEILLAVLENRFSVDSTALRWLKSYLSGRVQSIIDAGDHTHPVELQCSTRIRSRSCCFVSYTEDVVDLQERHAVQ